MVNPCEVSDGFAGRCNPLEKGLAAMATAANPFGDGRAASLVIDVLSA